MSNLLCTENENASEIDVVGKWCCEPAKQEEEGSKRVVMKYVYLATASY